MRRDVQIVAGALAVLAVTATAALAANTTGSQRSRSRCVAEPGTGGSSCVRGPNVEGTGTTQYCEGPSGAIALISDKHVKVVDGKLPSVVEKDSGEVAGPTAVAVSKRDQIGSSTFRVGCPAEAPTDVKTFAACLQLRSLAGHDGVRPCCSAPSRERVPLVCRRFAVYRLSERRLGKGGNGSSNAQPSPLPVRGSGYVAFKFRAAVDHSERGGARKGRCRRCRTVWTVIHTFTLRPGPGTSES